MTLKKYYLLTKPGIVYGNSLAALGGFLLAAHGHIEPGRLAAAIIGLALVIASACVFNNYIDRDIDLLMARTKRRALPSGQVSGLAALIYGALLGLLGVTLLLVCANLLAALAALAGWILYVIVYTYFKRHTVYGTQIGSLSGAVPPLVGYAASSGRLDLGAALLFAVLVLWQMPHFYAIAIFRHDDYRAAAIPVLPVKRGFRATRRSITAYIIALVLVAPLLTAAGYTGMTTLVVTSLAGFGWLGLSLRPVPAGGETGWAKRVFRFSLLMLLVLCLMWSVDVLLP